MPASALSKALKNTHSLTKYLSSSFYFPRLPSMWTHSRTGMEARAIVSKSSRRMFHLTFSIKFRFLPLKKKVRRVLAPWGGMGYRDLWACQLKRAGDGEAAQWIQAFPCKSNNLFDPWNSGEGRWREQILPSSPLT